MKKPPGIATKPAETATLLSVSPVESDHISLESILSRSEMWPRWAIHEKFEIESMLPMLRENRFPIVVAESDLLPGTWKDVLGEIATVSDPPLLIVTSRLADESLWAEALNLGAFDVLAKPFHTEEVSRTLALAWRHWQDRHGIHSQRTKQRVSASAA